KRLPGAGSWAAVWEAASVAVASRAEASTSKKVIVERIRAAVLAKCLSTQAMARVRSRSRAIAANAMHGQSSRLVSTRQVPRLQRGHRRRPVPRKAAYFVERPEERAWGRSVARSEETPEKARLSALQRAVSLA